MWRVAAIGVFLLAPHAAPQEIDTALSGSSPKTFTILDQIGDAEERQAFTRLYKKSSPAKRRDFAAAFVARFPSSWLLGEAYEIAAQASIEANDLPSGLNFAARSLRLWPENPLLLATVARVQSKLQMYDAAVESANRALWCLDRFDRPASISAAAWPDTQRRLRASSYFVLARVAASRGLAVSAQDRFGYLAEAESRLNEALRLDRRDPETLYLLGLVRLGLNRTDSAAACFAEAWRLHGTLDAEAMIRLKAIYRLAEPAGAVPFDQWMKSLKLAFPAPDLPHPAPAPSPEYAGSQICAGCHEREYASWEATGMSRMFRAYRPEDIAGDFSGSKAFADETGAPAVRTFIDRGKHYFEIRTADNRWFRYPVQYVIGSKWQQAYATRFPGGEIQVFPIQFNLLTRTWVNYWKSIDPPGSPRTDLRRFSNTVPSATYQFNCAPCHTSQLRLTGGSFHVNSASFLESGVNCEMCHGPSGGHAAAMRARQPPDKTASDPPVNFNRLSASEYVAICAQCHMQSGVRKPEKDGAINFSEEGPAFYRVSLSRPYVDFSRKAFYKDGRFRVTTFIVESFIRSACFRKGRATCGSCHDPHPANASSNPVSLKFPSDSDEMCLQCHNEFRMKGERHANHARESEASRCVSCHMPRIMEALLFSARSHQIDDVPDAEMAARFGPAESPNACLLCHKGKDAAWLARELQARNATLHSNGRELE